MAKKYQLVIAAAALLGAGCASVSPRAKPGAIPYGESLYIRDAVVTESAEMCMSPVQGVSGERVYRIEIDAVCKGQGYRMELPYIPSEKRAKKEAQRLFGMVTLEKPKEGDRIVYFTRNGAINEPVCELEDGKVKVWKPEIIKNLDRVSTKKPR